MEMKESGVTDEQRITETNVTLVQMNEPLGASLGVVIDKANIFCLMFFLAKSMYDRDIFSVIMKNLVFF